MLKWTDGTPVVPTRRGWIVFDAICVVVAVAAIVFLSVTSDDPCEGKVGDDYQWCVDLNYP